MQFIIFRLTPWKPACAFCHYSTSSRYPSICFRFSTTVRHVSTTWESQSHKFWKGFLTSVRSFITEIVTIELVTRSPFDLLRFLLLRKESSLRLFVFARYSFTSNLFLSNHLGGRKRRRAICHSALNGFLVLRFDSIPLWGTFIISIGGGIIAALIIKGLANNRIRKWVCRK